VFLHFNIDSCKKDHVTFS